MAKITLSNFSVLPVGNQVLKIVAVEYKESYGKLAITLENKNGDKHIERFSFIDNSGKANNGAIAAFSFFARIVLNDNTRKEIDHSELLNKFIRCDVIHDDVPSTKEPGKFVTYSRLENKEPAFGFDDEDPEAQKTPSANSNKSVKSMLDDILGDI